MKSRSQKGVSIFVILFTITVGLSPSPAEAEPGDFWYGLYGTDRTGSPWWDEAYHVFDSAFKMNWVYDGTRDSSQLDLISAAGLKAIIIPFWYGDQSGNLAHRYSESHYLPYQMEGDTIGWQWEPSGGWGIVLGRGGNRVSDQAADSGFAWFFDPATDTVSSEVYARIAVFRHPKKDPKFAQLRIQYRSIPDLESDDVLFYYGVRDGYACDTCYPYY